jgi:hypothetical protein
MGEDDRAALAREIRGECGLELLSGQPVARWTERETWVLRYLKGYDFAAAAVS